MHRFTTSAVTEESNDTGVLLLTVMGVIITKNLADTYCNRSCVGMENT